MTRKPTFALILCLLTASAFADKPKKSSKAATTAKAWIATMIAGNDVVSVSKDKPLRYWIVGNVDSCGAGFNDGASATKPDDVKKIKRCLQDQTKGRAVVDKSVKEISVAEAIDALPKYLHKAMRSAAKGTTIVHADLEGGEGPVELDLAVAGDGSVRVLWLSTPSPD